MDQLTASIVIRTFNEEKFLADLLQSIKNQSFQDFEIIVVDSGSLDSTRSIAAMYADQVIDIQSQDFTFGYALNKGIQVATGGYIVMVSAHTRPVDSAWLENLLVPLEDQNTAMVYGRQFGGATSKYSETRDMHRIFGPRSEVMKPPRYFANNANSAIRRSLWEIHPFDESLLGLEDIEWAKHWMDKDQQVVYEPKAAIYHIHEESWSQVRKRYYREAEAARRIGVKGLRHVITTPLIETCRLAMDWAQILTTNRAQIKNTGTRRYNLGEAFMFRLNKIWGTVKGLLTNAIKKQKVKKEDLLFDRSGEAVVISGVRKATLRQVGIPEVKPGDVLIRVAYEAVCATDIEIFEGSLGYYQNGLAQYPITPGHEFSGRIVAAGPNVDHVAIGDKVVVECIQSCGTCEACLNENFIGCDKRSEIGVIGRDGGYAEYVRTPARFVHPLPPELDLLTACLSEPLAVSLKGLKRLRRTWMNKQKKTSMRCAVVGAGPLGHLCARVLAHWGHQVNVFDRNPKRLTYFAGSDIDTSKAFDRIIAFDYIVEATGSPEALDSILHQSKAGATILLLGLPYAHRNFSFESIVAYDKIIVGSVGSSAKHFRKAIELLPQIETSAFFEKIMPLSEFIQAWQISRSQECLKVILEVAGSGD